jgi:hypothetical protein
LPNPGFPNQAVQEITSSLPMFEKGREFKLLHQNRRDEIVHAIETTIDPL